MMKEVLRILQQLSSSKCESMNLGSLNKKKLNVMFMERNEEFE